MEHANSLHVISATTSPPRTDSDQDAPRTFHHANMNSSPIFWLPTETLQAIFIRCASDHYYGDNHGFSTKTPPSWVNVSYVCRHWRSVALNCPILWTFLFAVSARWMEELLSRSTQAPLKFHLAEGISFLSQTPLAMILLEKVANHAERIQELDLSLYSLLPEQFISKLFSHAPLLQKVKLAVEIFPEQDWSQSILLNTPVLHTLEVFRFRIPWGSFMLSRVRTLSLRYFHSQSQETMEQFLASLSCMQDLRHLYLDSALPRVTGFLSSSVFRTFHKIDLPCLSRLLIIDSLSTIITLFSCVNIPLKTEIRLLYSELTDDDAMLSPLFAQRFGMLEDQTLSSPTIRSLSIDFEDFAGDSMMSVSFSSHDNHPFYSSMEKSWGDGIPLKIVTKRSESMTDNENRIMTIICSVPLIDVCSIRVDHPPFSSRFWLAFLGHFPNLRYLELSNGYFPDIAPALSFTTIADEQEGHLDDARAQHQFLVPKLETLSLHYLLFGEDSLNSDGDDDPQEKALPTDAQMVLDALASRTESPRQLTTVSYMLRSVGGLGSGHFRIVVDDDE